MQAGCRRGPFDQRSTDSDVEWRYLRRESLVDGITEKYRELGSNSRRERLDGKMLPVGSLGVFATFATDVFEFVLFSKRNSVLLSQNYMLPVCPMMSVGSRLDMYDKTGQGNPSGIYHDSELGARTFFRGEGDLKWVVSTTLGQLAPILQKPNQRRLRPVP